MQLMMSYFWWDNIFTSIKSAFLHLHLCLIYIPNYLTLDIVNASDLASLYPARFSTHIQLLLGRAHRFLIPPGRFIQVPDSDTVTCCCAFSSFETCQVSFKGFKVWGNYKPKDNKSFYGLYTCLYLLFTYPEFVQYRMRSKFFTIRKSDTFLSDYLTDLKLHRTKQILS